MPSPSSTHTHTHTVHTHANAMLWPVCCLHAIHHLHCSHPTVKSLGNFATKSNLPKAVPLHFDTVFRKTSQPREPRPTTSLSTFTWTTKSPLSDLMMLARNRTRLQALPQQIPCLAHTQDVVELMLSFETGLFVHGLTCATIKTLFRDIFSTPCPMQLPLQWFTSSDHFSYT
jgi:hypothetical protein